MLLDNVGRRLRAAAMLLAHAQAEKVGNSAKSSYYRSSLILLCSIVEGLVYQLVKKHTLPPHVIDEPIEHKERHRISASVFATSGDLVICERKRKRICIDDEG